MAVGLWLWLRHTTEEAPEPGVRATDDSARDDDKDGKDSVDGVRRARVPTPQTNPFVAGRVFASGSAYSGAVVELRDGDRLVAAAESDGDGRFDLGARPSGDFAVSARAPGQRTARVEVTSKSPSDNLRLDLRPCAAVVTGVVRDADGGLVAGARLVAILASPSGPTFAGEDTSDDRGAVQLCTVPGNLRVRVLADGYATSVVGVQAEVATRHDFVVTPEAVITGRVVAAPDGAPLAGARVYAAGGTIERSDQNGAFNIGKLAPGRHTVVCELEGYFDTRDLEVTTQIGAATTVECWLTRGLVLAGRVVGDGERPAANVHLRASADRTRVFADSDGQGRFRLAGLAPGPVTLTAGDDELVEPEKMDLARDEDGVTLHLRRKAQASLAGRVLAKGQPVASAEVVSGGQTVTTDASGAYFLTGLAPGAQLVTARAEAMGARGQRTVAVAAGEDKTGVDIELDVAAEVSGRVVDAAGKPQPRLAVRLDCEEAHVDGEATTGADGTFKVRYLRAPCAYTVWVGPQGAGGNYPVTPKKVTLSESDGHVGNVELVVTVARGTIAGRVVDGAGAPVGDVRVFAGQPESGRGAAETTTRSDGGFELLDLPVGEYFIGAMPPNRPRAGVAGVATGRTDVVVTLPAEATIHGRLVGFAADAHVEAGMRSARPARDGTFVLDGLPAGKTVVVSGYDGNSRALTELALVPGENAVTLDAHAWATLEGRVAHGDGSVVAGVLCIVTSATAGYLSEARLDGEGHFLLQAPPGMRVEISCGDKSLWKDVAPSTGLTDLHLVL